MGKPQSFPRSMLGEGLTGMEGHTKKTERCSGYMKKGNRRGLSSKRSGGKQVQRTDKGWLLFPIKGKNTLKGWSELCVHQKGRKTKKIAKKKNEDCTTGARKKKNIEKKDGWTCGGGRKGRKPRTNQEKRKRIGRMWAGGGIGKKN